MDALAKSFYSAMLSGLGECPVWVPPNLSSTLQSQLTSFVAWQLSCVPDFKPEKTLVTPDRLKSVHLNMIHPERYRLVICLGAGIDSTIAVYYAIKVLNFLPEDIAVLHISYGAPYENKEKKATLELRRQFRDLGVEVFTARIEDAHRGGKCLDASKFPRGYIIPVRNPLLATIGSIVGDEVWIVANWRKIEDGKATLDKGRKFYGHMSELLSMYWERPIQVRSPFLHMTKAASIRWFINEFGMEAAETLLAKTVSCYSDFGEGRCGECYSCYKAYKVFQKFGMQKLLNSFETNPEEYDMFEEFERREREKGRHLEVVE